MSIMIFMVLLYLIFQLMPFFIAGVSYGKGEPVVLKIKNDNVRDPRYFSKSFRARMEKALENYDGSGEIMLSKKEKIVSPPFLEKEVEGIVYLAEDYRETEERLFYSEVYALGSASFGDDCSIRAIAGTGRVRLGSNTEIVRWVDSEEELFCDYGCDLGISASSAKTIKIAGDCSFFRLYAPVICIGAGTTTDYLAPHAKQKEEGIERTHKVEEGEIITTDLISSGKLMIEGDAVILGSVKARKDIHVCSGATIMGNLVSEGTIVLEDDVYVAGNIFSQYSVYIGKNCQIGKGHQIKSLIAQENIYLCEGCKIFGFVSCEKGGKVVNEDKYISLINDCY